MKKFQLPFLWPVERRECDQYQEVENTMIGNGNGKKGGGGDIENAE